MGFRTCSLAVLAAVCGAVPHALAQLPGPSVALTKTVGTVAGVCAATDTITLPSGGGQVYYCYQGRNTGGVTLTLHDLVDDRLGQILNDVPYTYPPGGTGPAVIVAATVTSTTVNTATWTAFNAGASGPVDVASSRDSATVVVGEPRPAVALTKTVGTVAGVCATTDTITLPPGGGQVYYCYLGRNTGNVTLTLHDLVDDRLGQILNDVPYTYLPGATGPAVIVPAVVRVTTTNTATWTAFTGTPANPAFPASSQDSATVVVELPPPIPALGPAGLAVLAGVLALAAVAALRARPAV